MNDKPLVIIAHPQLAQSRLNAALIGGLRESGAAEVHDLYAAYPDGHIDVGAEQRRIEAHSRVLFQFPLYWYSCPPFLSTWLVEVYRRGWAYGPGGRALNFKTFGVAVTTGSNGRDYTAEGRYRHTLDDVLVPFELLARHSGMHWLPPFTTTAAREVSDDELVQRARDYCEHVTSAQPSFMFDGRDDSRAKTVYPAHYYTSDANGTSDCRGGNVEQPHV